MSVRQRKLLLILAFTFRTMIVHTSQIASTWTRDWRLDDVIKVSGLPYQEVAGGTASLVDCASRCSPHLSCFSFFFPPSAGRCLLNEFVLTKPDGGQPSSGARYFRRESVDCPVSDGFVWLLNRHMCIKVFQSHTTFTYAYRNCTSVGSRLAVLDTRDKLNAVDKYLGKNYSRTRAFIGAMREGAYSGTRTSWNTTLHPMYWLNGNEVTTSGPDAHWWKRNPDNWKGLEGCLEVIYGKWNDRLCDTSLPFICEKVLV